MRVEIESRVCGIPCVILVTEYKKIKARGPSADSDIDCYGGTEFSYEILDRRGRPAAWLERKVAKNDRELQRIDEVILERFGEME